MMDLLVQSMLEVQVDSVRNSRRKKRCRVTGCAIQGLDS